ncbi:MAG TPA: hypothetical protein VHG53_04185 [Candidatus Limnocylindria bacterium]|nr:hypothetical protein [Candidatus Limnocylindria bacterium]
MADRALSAPKDVVYEPGERVIAVGRPFAWWVALVGVELVLLIGAAALAAQSQQ